MIRSYKVPGKLDKYEDFRLHLEVMPEPYFGNQGAAVVLLGLNPGFCPADILAHQDADFALTVRGNLAHKLGNEFPLYHL